MQRTPSSLNPTPRAHCPLFHSHDLPFCGAENLFQVTQAEIVSSLFCQSNVASALQDLIFFYFFYLFVFLRFYLGAPDPQLRHTGSLVMACGIQFPDQGSNPGPLPWEGRVLATGPPGKCLGFAFNVLSENQKTQKMVLTAKPGSQDHGFNSKKSFLQPQMETLPSSLRCQPQSHPSILPSQADVASG